MAHRIWNLRLNLDEFNAIYGSAFTDSAKAMMLSGMFVGMNGGSIPEDSSKILRDVFEMCSRMREEAEGFSRRKSEGGKNSAESRKAKYGSAQPPRSDFEDTSEESSEESFEVISNQSTIPNPLTNNLTNDKPEKKIAASKKPLRPSGMYVPPSPIPEALLKVAEWLVKDWPPVSYGKDGSSRKVSRYSVTGMWGRIEHVAQKCGVETGPLLFSGVCYLETVLEDSKDTGKAMYVKDMSNFWGIREDTRKWDETYEVAKERYLTFMETK